MSGRRILAAPLIFCVATLFGFGNAHAAPAPRVCKLARAPSKDFGLKMPFDIVDGRIYVQARVNGRGPFKFAVDTGASGWGRADASLVAALHLKMHKPAMTSDGVRAAKVATVHLDSLELGGLSRKNLDVVTRDYSSRMSPDAAFSGIIGREFFADGLLIIDYPARTLSFSRKLSLSPSEAHVLSYERAFRVPISIGDLRTEGESRYRRQRDFRLAQVAVRTRFGCSVATGRTRSAHEFADRDDALHGARTLPDRRGEPVQGSGPRLGSLSGTVGRRACAATLRRHD